MKPPSAPGIKRSRLRGRIENRLSPAKYERGDAETQRQPQRAPFWFSLLDRKSTRLNSSHTAISYAVLCLKKKQRGPLSNDLLRPGGCGGQGATLRPSPTGQLKVHSTGTSAAAQLRPAATVMSARPQYWTG